MSHLLCFTHCTNCTLHKLSHLYLTPVISLISHTNPLISYTSKKSIISTFLKAVAQRSNVNCPKVFQRCVNGWLGPGTGIHDSKAPALTVTPHSHTVFLCQVISINLTDGICPCIKPILLEDSNN